MGMFDYVECELPLPVGRGRVYQTKDTQEWCEMELFVIRADGRLIKHEYDLEDTPEDELPYRDAPKDSILSLCGSIRKMAGSEREEDQNFDGDLIFYAFEDDSNMKGWIEYRATFRNGNCIEICQAVDRKWRRVWAPEEKGSHD